MNKNLAPLEKRLAPVLISRFLDKKFAKLADYAGESPPRDMARRLALTGKMAARALRSAWRAGRFDREPIVIGGCGRSGTTLLLAMLSAHPRIFAIPVETLAFCPTGYRPEPDLDAPFELRRIHRQLLLQEIPPGRRRWTEKTPRNVLYFQRILDHYNGRVRLIHLVRDGRDVVTSRHPTDPERTWVSARRWTRDVAAGRALEDHPAVLTLRYEDLVHRFENTAATLCDFLDEPLAPELLAWHQHATVRTNTAWFGRVKPLHTDSVARWQRPEYADRVAELVADPSARELLDHYGYR